MDTNQDRALDASPALFPKARIPSLRAGREPAGGYLPSSHAPELIIGEQSVSVVLTTCIGNRLQLGALAKQHPLGLLFLSGFFFFF